MAKFRKKPRIIDAHQWNGHNRHELIEFLGIPPEAIAATNPIGAFLFIRTLEGEMQANPGDWA